MKTIRSMLTKAAARYHDHTAYIVKRGKEHVRIVYPELLSDVSRLASGLTALGCENNRIAVSGRNSYEWAVAALAVFFSNNILVPIDASLPEGDFSRIVRRSEATALLYSDELKSKADRQELPHKIPFTALRDHMGDGILPASERSPEEMSILMFTSGTTSEAKAVMLSQTNVVANIDAMMEWEIFLDTDLNLALLPYHHAFGLTALLLFLMCGTASAYCEGFKFKKALEEYPVTLFVVIPPVLSAIRRTIEIQLRKKHALGLFHGQLALSRALRRLHIDLRKPMFSYIRKKLGPLRFIVSGAAPLSPEVWQFFNDIGILLVQGYGMTEAAPVLAAENHVFQKAGSVGKALPGIDIKIDAPDENGHGEVIAKGKNVMLGYMNHEENPIKDGYLYTGDIGYLDDEGFLFLCGRKKNVIVLRSGKNVFPEELEELVGQIEGVKESVVYLPEGDHALLSVKIVYDEAASPEAVKAAVEQLNDTLPEYKKLRSVSLTTDPFPKTTTGKIKRAEVL